MTRFYFGGTVRHEQTLFLSTGTKYPQTSYQNEDWFI